MKRSVACTLKDVRVKAREIKHLPLVNIKTSQPLEQVHELSIFVTCWPWDKEHSLFFIHYSHYSHNQGSEFESAGIKYLFKLLGIKKNCTIP